MRRMQDNRSDRRGRHGRARRLAIGVVVWLLAGALGALLASAIQTTTATASPTPGCIPPPSGLVAWWPGDGNAKDIAGGRDGTLENGAGFATGKVGQAFSFTPPQFVSVPDDPLWTLGSEPFTVDMWVNYQTLLPRSPFIGHDDGGGQENKWIFWFDAAGHREPGGPALRFHVNYFPDGPILDTAVAPWSPAVGQWYHVAVTRLGSAYSLYVDGSLAITELDDNAIPDASFPLTIGNAESFFFDGLIDEVEIFNRALSGAEIHALFAADSAGKCKEPTPAAISLSPSDAVNNVGTTHTVTATVTDASAQPVAGITARFTVTGTTTTSGRCTTSATGQCSFSYQGPALPGADRIDAYADTNGNYIPDDGEPTAVPATKAWILPSSTPGHTTGGGQILNSLATDKIAFGFTAKTSAAGVKGECTLVDPSTDTKVKCVDATNLVVSGTHATIFGHANVNNTATTYRIDVDDLAEPGTGHDTFTIQTATGYTASGTLQGGNIQVH